MVPGVTFMYENSGNILRSPTSGKAWFIEEWNKILAPYFASSPFTNPIHLHMLRSRAIMPALAFHHGYIQRFGV